MKALFKNFAIYGLSAAIGKFFGILLTPVYTRYFSPADYGLIDVLTAFTYIVTIMAALEIWNGISRDYPNKSDGIDRQTLISSGFWFIIIGSVVVTVASIVFYKPITALLFDSQSHNTTYIMAVSLIPISAMNTYCNILIRFEQKPWLLFTASIIQIISNTVISLMLIIVFDMGVRGYFIGQIISVLLPVGFLLWHLKQYIRFTLDTKIVRYALQFSVPMIPAIIGIWLNTYAGRFLMLQYLSLEVVGIYAIGLKVSSIFLFIEYAFRLAWTPYFYDLIKTNDYQLQLVKIYKSLLYTVTVIVVVVMFFSREIIILLTTPQYYNAMTIAGLLCIPAVLQIFIQIVGVGSIIHRKTIYDTYAYLLGMLVNLFTMFFFVPLWGIVGVALSLTLGSLVTFWLFCYFSYILCGIRFPILKTALIMMLWIAVALGFGLFEVPILMKFAISIIITTTTMILLFIQYKKKRRGIIFEFVKLLNARK
jgi:O-antigen/teichoic acid export membrane protein